MSVFSPIRIDKFNKVHHSEYIRTENEPADTAPKPADPQTPVQPEAK